MILTRMAVLAVQIYSYATWGSTLQYESVALQGNKLLFTQPRLDHFQHFQAEKVGLQCDFDWKNHILDIRMDVERSSWSLDHPYTVTQDIWDKLAGESWLQTHLHLHITDGSLMRSNEGASQPEDIHFEVTADSREGAFIKICFDPQNPSVNKMELKTSSSSYGMDVTCTCRQTSSRSLLGLSEILGFSLPQLRVTEGIVDGTIKAVFPNQQRPYLEGKLALGQLVFSLDTHFLQGGIEGAVLTFEHNEGVDHSKSESSTITGNLKIQKSAFLSHNHPERSWLIREIRGDIQFNGIESLRVELEALAERHEQRSHWALNGKTTINAQRPLDLTLLLTCTSEKNSEGKIEFALHQIKEKYKCATIKLESLFYTDLNLLQSLFATFWPAFDELELKSGLFDALLEADVGSHGVGEIRFKQFSASHLTSMIKPWGAVIDCDLFRGYGKVHLGREDFWGSLQAGLHLENGCVNFESLSPKLPFTDIQGHFLIQNGQIENSLVTLQLAGLKGKLDVEWGEPKHLLTLKLDGTVSDLAKFFPNVLQEGLKQHFYHNRLMVLANIKKLDHQIELGGTIHIQEPTEDYLHTIHFGCELNRKTSDPRSNYLPKGWFYSNRLPVEKFISPFIFRDGLLHMEGDAEFKGSFDHRMVTVKYDADNLMIENENLKIEIERVHSSIPGQLVGMHQLDLDTFRHEGTLPIEHATYYDKNSGFLFCDIQGIAHFEPSLIQINSLEASSHGLDFCGSLELDYSNPAPGVFNLSIHCPTLFGKVSQVQHLLAHLEPSSLLHQIPLEGQVSAKGEGLTLDFVFSPEDYKLQADLKGSIVEGTIPFHSAEMALRGIYMDVDYHHRDKRLEFSDIQGAFIVGKAIRAEEYLFTGDHVRITLLPDPELDIDIAIKDHDDEIFRLVARTENEGAGVKHLCIDPQVTHISCIYPQTWSCRLLDGFHVEEFEFKSTFDLNAFFKDLSRFKKCGLFFLSHTMLDKLPMILPLGGTGTISLQGKAEQSYDFQFEGNGIKRGKSHEHYAVLQGSKRAKKWIIDKIQWDDWNAYGEFQQEEKRWKIPFLGLNIGQNVLLALEGDFMPHDGLLQASLKFCELDLAKIDRWDILKPFSAKWHPKGIIKASGEIEWSLLLSDPMEGFKASLIAESNDLSFRNYPLGILEPFRIGFNGTKGFSITGVGLSSLQLLDVPLPN